MKSKRLLVFFVVLFVAFFVSGRFSPKVSSQSPSVTLGAWRETATFADSAHRSHPLPSFAVGKYFYVHTKTDCSTCKDDRIVYMGLQQADGSLSVWQVANTDHGGGPHGYTAVATNDTAYHFRNGHIAQYVINQSNGTISEIKLLENVSYRDPFSGNKYMWDTAVYVPFVHAYSYIYHLGGFNMTTHAYDVNDMFRAGVPLPDQNAYFLNLQQPKVPTNNPNKAAFYKSSLQADRGYIYMGVRGSSKLYRIQVIEDIGASPTSWIDSGDLPQGTGNNLGDLFVVQDTLFTIRGSKVFKAVINAENGSLSAWDDSPPDLPEDQIDVNWDIGNAEGASYGIIGNYVYVTGPKKVYYAQINGDGGITPTVTVAPTATPAFLPVLPQTISGHAMIAINGQIYTFGGRIADTYTDGGRLNRHAFTDKIYRFDGTQWIDAGRLPRAMIQEEVVVKDNRVYVAGGYDGQDNSQDVYVATQDVYVATIGLDHTISPFTFLNQMPEKKSDFLLLRSNNTIYAIGGFDGHQPSQHVYKASIDDSSGMLSAWQATADLPRNRFGVKGFVYGEYVYVLGARASGHYSLSENSVLFAHINAATGLLDAWQTGPPALVREVSNHKIVLDGSDVYIVNGSYRANDNTVIDSRAIDRYQIQAPGVLSFINTVGTVHTQATYFGAALLNGAIYVGGGETATTDSIPVNTFLIAYTIPQTTPIPTGHPCIVQARIGDYDCSGVVNATDFDAWKTDFLASRSTLSFFEYFRRAFAW